MNREDFVKALSAAVLTDRRVNYGPPERNFDAIASLWGAYRHHKQQACIAKDDDLGQYFDAEDVAIMMALVKVARLIQTPNHIDSWVDIAGYAACGAEIVGD